MLMSSPDDLSPIKSSRSRLRRSLGGDTYHVVQNFFEILQPRRGNDNCIAPAAHVLGNAQKPAARILFQGNDKGLALDLDFVRLERVFVHRRFRSPVRAAPVS